MHAGTELSVPEFYDLLPEGCEGCRAVFAAL
jgi:hypothetical protein